MCVKGSTVAWMTWSRTKQNMKTEIWVGKVDLTGIYNHFKTLQFINFGNNGTANRLVYAGREECKQMIRENPECGRMQADDSGKPQMWKNASRWFGKTPNVWLSVLWWRNWGCQVIFKGNGITSRMVNPNIPTLIVPTTKNRVQDKNSL